MEKKTTKETEKIRPGKIINYLKISFIGFLCLFLFSAVVVGGISFSYLHRFTKAAEINKKELIQQTVEGFKNSYSEKYLNFLILGLDKRPEDNSLLTDTMLVASFNVENGDYLLFSIPRDLWIDDLKTKINSLYYYGQKIDPDDGTEMVKDKIEEILKTDINYTLVLEMEDIEKLVDQLGGVSVNVDRTFVDSFYPLDDGSGEVMTVKFKQGEQTFDGEKALQYMRSRKSEDEIEGTDQARQIRQKKVILGIRDKLLNSGRLIKSPKKMGELYKFIKAEIKIVPELTIKNIASFWRLVENMSDGEAVEAEIPWQVDDEERILTYGYLNYNGGYVWVMTPVDNNWELISEYYHEKLP